MNCKKHKLLYLEHIFETEKYLKIFLIEICETSLS